MLYTSAEANKLLKKLAEEKQLIEKDEDLKSTFNAATTEDPEKLRPAYSYEDTTTALDEINTKIRKIKHAINVFNTVTEVPEFGMTIDQVLIYLPQLSRRIAILRQMSTRMSKMRASSIFGAKTGIIDYTYINYDLIKVKKDYQELIALQAKIQTALDVVNSTEKMEIDI